MYYTVTTIATVGYGDISGTNTTERIICIFLMISGVFFFSFSSGTLTNIISNQEAKHAAYHDKEITLNRIFQENQLPPELYYQVKSFLRHQADKTQDTVDFLNELPISLRVRVNDHIYKNTYKQINFLQDKDISFKTWLCPQLKSQLFQQDVHIYYETDLVDSIYFLCNGAAGFVIPFLHNVVYLEIDEGDGFGESDVVQTCLEESISLLDIINGEGMPKRSFTVLALINCEVLAMPLPVLQRMSKEFFAQFESIFEFADLKLQKMRMQQLRCIKKCQDETFIKRYDKLESSKFIKHANTLKNAKLKHKNHHK